MPVAMSLPYDSLLRISLQNSFFNLKGTELKRQTNLTQPSDCVFRKTNPRHQNTPTMILTVTVACPGGMVPSVSTASTVNVYTGSESASAS